MRSCASSTTRAAPGPRRRVARVRARADPRIKDTSRRRRGKMASRAAAAERLGPEEAAGPDSRWSTAARPAGRLPGDRRRGPRLAQVPREQFVSIEMDVVVKGDKRARVGMFVSRERQQQQATKATSFILRRAPTEGGTARRTMDKTTPRRKHRRRSARRRPVVARGQARAPAHRARRRGPRHARPLSVDGIPVAEASRCAPPPRGGEVRVDCSRAATAARRGRHHRQRSSVYRRTR